MKESKTAARLKQPVLRSKYGVKARPIARSPLTITKPVTHYPTATPSSTSFDYQKPATSKHVRIPKKKKAKQVTKNFMQ